jgi:hypothetical protein
VPGRFWFNTCEPVAIEVTRIGEVSPDYGDPAFSQPALLRQVRALYEGPA